MSSAGCWWRTARWTARRPAARWGRAQVARDVGQLRAAGRLGHYEVAVTVVGQRNRIQRELRRVATQASPQREARQVGADGGDALLQQTVEQNQPDGGGEAVQVKAPADAGPAQAQSPQVRVGDDPVTE